jgi:hypothetical protein
MTNRVSKIKRTKGQTMIYKYYIEISVTYDYGYIPFVVFTIRFFPLFLITGVVTRVTRIAACGAGIAYTSIAHELTHRLLILSRILFLSPSYALTHNKNI